MSRRTYTEHEPQTKEIIQSMLFSEIRDKLYESRKRALLNPTKENINELKKLIKYIKEELDL